MGEVIPGRPEIERGASDRSGPLGEAATRGMRKLRQAVGREGEGGLCSKEEGGSREPHAGGLGRGLGGEREREREIEAWRPLVLAVKRPPSPENRGQNPSYREVRD